MADYETLLNFWFGDAASPSPEVQKQWFVASAEFDRQIRQHFGSLLESAAAGELVGWQEQPRSCLALILLLDQFPRNIYRGTAAAFACDERARVVCEAGLAAGLDRQLTWLERSFFYLPLEHAENLAAQQHCVELFTRLCDEAPPQYSEQAQTSLRFARDHCDIVARFGRFPHRNEVLGRKSTADELEYLKKGTRYGQ